MPSRSTFTSSRNLLPFAHRDKEEIVTLGLPGIDPTEVVGQYAEPEDWNALIKDPDVLLVDTRNDYEVELGTFKGALDPDTQNFSEWPDFVKDSLENPKSEKWRCFARGHQVRESICPPLQNGFDEVYHLRGGILHYLENLPRGKPVGRRMLLSFITKSRSLTDSKDGKAVLCFGCRWPLTGEDLSSRITRRAFHARNATGA